jgi:hypothetical protein
MPRAREFGPLHVPSLMEGERDALMPDLRVWVDRLMDRFTLDTRVVPPCWEQHNGIVEALSALRDHERGSYAADADPRAAVDWLRALREVRILLAELAALTQCSAHQHRDPPPRRLPLAASTAAEDHDTGPRAS